MRNRALAFLSLLAGAFVPGCADVRTTVSYPMTIQIRDTRSGSAVASASLDAAWSGRRPTSADYNAGLDQFAYRRRNTDSQGRATLDLDIPAMANVILLMPVHPSLEPPVGRDVLLRVKTEQHSELLFVTFGRDKTFAGQLFSVTIESVRAGRELFGKEAKAVDGAWNTAMQSKSAELASLH